MANALYPAAKEDFLSGNLNLASNTITVALVSNTYTFSAGHLSRADVPNTSIISTVNLASKSVANGVFDATDPVFPTVSGNTVTSILIYHNTGTQSTSRLIGFVDTATGLPLVPAGLDITIQFSNLANKIFTL